MAGRSERGMGKVTGFLEIERARIAPIKPVAERAKRLARIRHAAAGEGSPRAGGALHGLRRTLLLRHQPHHRAPTGCSGQQPDPDWNDLVYRGNWEEAARNLHSTNNFPEFTGRVCPGALRSVLHAQHRRQRGHHQDHRMRDRRPRDRAAPGKPDKPQRKTGKKVAVVGSGPGGFCACAQQLARAGHEVHVYERWAKAGGLLALRHSSISRWRRSTSTVASSRCRREGVSSSMTIPISASTCPVDKLLKQHDAVVLTGGSEEAARPADSGPRA